MRPSNRFLFILVGLLMAILQANASLPEAFEVLESGDTARAQTMFLKISKEAPNNTDALLYLAMLNEYMEDLDKAEDYIERAYLASATSQAKVRAKIANWRGIIMEQQAEASSFFSAGDYAEKALASYTEANQLAPNEFAYLSRLTTFYLEAPSMMGGNTEKGESLLSVLMKKDKRAGYKVLIEHQLESEQDDTALDTFKTAIKEFPNDPDFYQKRAFYWLVNKEYFKASQDLRSSYSIQAKSKFDKGIQLISLYQFAKLCIKTKQDYPHAQKALNTLKSNYQWVEGLSIPPLDWVEFRLANILDLNSQADSARDIYRELYRTTKDESLKKLISKKI